MNLYMGFNQIITQVSCSFVQASDRFAAGCTVVITKGAEAKEKVSTFASENFKAATESQIWKENGKPVYERTVGKLDKYDYLLLGGAAATAGAVIALAVKIFSIGVLPLAAGAGTLIVLGAGLIVRERVRCQHNNKAKEHLNALNRGLKTGADPVHLISKFKELEKPEFGHLSQQFSPIKDHFSGLNNTADRDEWRKICRIHVIDALNFVAPNEPPNPPASPIPEELKSDKTESLKNPVENLACESHPGEEEKTDHLSNHDVHQGGQDIVEGGDDRT